MTPTSNSPGAPNIRNVGKNRNCRRALLVVDMSVEQLSSLEYRRSEIIETIRSLLSLEWTLKIDSRLSLGHPEESTLSKVYPEWGHTMGIPGSVGASLCPELRGLGLEFIEKKHYSSFVDSRLQERLDGENIAEVYTVGINTDYCVFFTAVDALCRGKYDTFVVEEGVSSKRAAEGHQYGLRLIRVHLGRDAVVSVKSIR